MLGPIKETAKKVFKILVATAFTVGCLVAAVMYLRSDLLNIQEVEVFQRASIQSGSVFTSIREEMVPKLTGLYGKSILGVGLDDVYENLQKDRRIKEVRISRSFPNKIKVEVEPHIPIANILSSKGDRVYPLTKEGSLFAPVPLSESADAPILRGRSFLKDMQLRKKTLSFLSEFSDQTDFRLEDVSEIHFDEKRGYVLVLNREASEVLLGHRDFKKRLEYVGRVLQYLRAENLKGRVIDARFSKKVVVRLRNAS